MDQDRINGAEPKQDVTIKNINESESHKRKRQALEELDNAKLSWFHIRACLVSGIGFFTVI